MKTLPFVVLSLIAASLMAAAQAMAQEGDACPHDEPTVAALRECVEHAIEHGHIDNAGFARGLLATLDAAQDAVDRGQEDVAVNLLTAFIHQVEAQAGKSIQEPHASHLIHHAEDVIKELGG